MLKNPPEDMPRISPHLFYDDLDAAIDWLVNAFGFAVRVRMTDPHGDVVHGELEFADGLVLLGLAEENEVWESPNAIDGHITQRLYIFVNDVDRHCECARRAGAKILYEPADQFYGDRVYECIDPEGHRWKFAQHIKDVDMKTLGIHLRRDTL
ncbi:MAG: VOC family protein [bacterium]|nr:VOC family protein [bacterium]